MPEKHLAVRPEEPGDADDVLLVNERAFGGPAEAALVAALRGLPDAISLVAALDDRIVGHILFTPVRIDGVEPEVSAAGLAPLAVLPEHQRRGIGSQLVRAGLEACRARGHCVIVVVGHPEYYPRFGFIPGSSKGLEYEHPVSPGAFMVLELEAGTLRHGGIVRYRPEFSSV